MNRKLVLGDIHGAHRALVQVLERCGFDRAADQLIFLGDVADGWPETRACIDELLTIPNRVCLIGNHDEWFAEWARGGKPEPMWTMQGGNATLVSYGGQRSMVPETHRTYLRDAKFWHEDDGRVFMHGGFPYYQFSHPMECPDLLTWDRDLWTMALTEHRRGRSGPLTKFREVYVGHTTTVHRGFTEPAHCCEVWNLDQGAGWEGKLSIMDVETKEFWQSDKVSDLYPETVNARRAA